MRIEEGAGSVAAAAAESEGIFGVSSGVDVCGGAMSWREFRMLSGRVPGAGAGGREITRSRGTFGNFRSQRGRRETLP